MSITLRDPVHRGRPTRLLILWNLAGSGFPFAGRPLARPVRNAGASGPTAEGPTAPAWRGGGRRTASAPPFGIFFIALACIQY